MKLEVKFVGYSHCDQLVAEIVADNWVLVEMSDEKTGRLEARIDYLDRDGIRRVRTVAYGDFMDAMDRSIRRLQLDPSSRVPEPIQPVLTVKAVCGKRRGMSMAEIRHREALFAVVRQERVGEALVEFHPHPTDECWELPCEELVAAFKDAREAFRKT